MNCTKIYISFILSLILFVDHANAQCSVTAGPTYTNSCAFEYFTNISASGTGVTSTIAISGISSCGGIWFPDYALYGISASPGNTVRMAIKRVIPATYQAYVSVYVDWNNNGTYETSELCGTQMTWAPTRSDTFYNFTVPTGAVVGTHLHMRLFLSEVSGGAPCAGTYGQAYGFYFQVNCATPVISASPTATSMCPGDAGRTLTASGAGTGGTYRWSPATGLSATTGATVTAAPATTTVYTVTGTTSGGCYSTGTSTVTVNPVPSPIGGSSQVCASAIITLTDATTGGTWTSGNVSIATINSSTGVLSGVASGTASITYTLATGCYNTTIITVNPLPNPIAGTLSACIGSTSTLSDVSTSGTWISSNLAVATIGSADGLVNGLSNGTAQITYILPTGCQTVSTFTVNPLPAPITGTFQECVGFVTLLADATPGGTWSSSNPAVAANVFVPGLISGVSSGTATITYTISSTGCYATAGFTVNPSPLPITGTLRICVGSTTNLSDATPGGVWSSTNISVATIGTTGIVTGMAPGTATISYSPSAGCPAIKIVTVFPIPTAIVGPTSVCTGSNITLSDAVTGGIWSNPGFSGTCIIGSSTGIVTGVSAGSAVITYTLAAGCLAYTNINIVPGPAPITGAISICQGQATTLSDISAGGTWSNSGTAVSIGSSSGIVSGISSGTALISYTIANGCIGTYPFTVNPLPVAITGSNNVCVGRSTTLTDASTGGTWGNGGASTIATIGTGTGLVTGISAGTLSITYTLPSGCSINSTITVNPLPASITGTMQVCVGATTTLGSATSGGTWSNSGVSATIGTSSGIAIGVSAGTSIITYTSAFGCITTSVLTINPLPPAISGPSAVCIGSTITDTNAVAGGTWSTSSTNLSIGVTTGDITGLVAGTGIITYILATGCYTTATIIVNPLPARITGNNTLCQADTTTLSDVSTGGIWSSASFEAVIDPTTGLVTALVAGTTIMTYTLPTGCMRDTIIRINPIPAPITGPSGVCLGFTTALFDGTPSGTWSNAGTTAIATISSSGIVTGLAVGTATITYRLSTGCLTSTLFSIYPLPSVITGPSNVCERTTITLSDSLGGGSWTSYDTAIAQADTLTGIITGIHAGTTVITYTSANGCTKTKIVTVILAPLPITGVPSVCTGSTTALTDSTSGGTWSNTGSATVATMDSTGLVTGLSAGTISVTYTINTGCFAHEDILVTPRPSIITGITTVCAGDSTPLSDSVAGGTWTSADTLIARVGATGSLTGVTAGTTVITYSTGVDCQAIITVTVLPVITPISGPDMVCVGQTIVLTDGLLFGTWTSGNTTFAIVNSSGLVTGVSQGIVTISYVVANTCGTATHTVTVNPLPYAGVIVGSHTVCTGSTIQLNDAISGGTWSSSIPAIASISTTGLVSGNSTGTDSIFYRVTNICGTDIARFAIFVQQTPVAEQISTYPANPLCNNTKFQNFGALNAPASGLTYNWSAVNAEIYATSPDHQNCLISFNAPGNSLVILATGTVGTTCYKADTLRYSISSYAAIPTQVLYQLPEFLCTDNTTDFYQWGYDDALTLDSILLPGEINQNLIIKHPDFTNRYYWVITGHYGCTQKTYYNQPTDIQGQTTSLEKGMAIYPNPAGNEITITLKKDIGTGPIEIKVIDILGKIAKFSTFTNYKGILTLEGLSSGTYMVIAEKDGNRIGSEVFIKY